MNSLIFMFFYEFGCKVMQTSQVLRSKVQLLLCHSSLHLNLGIAIHLPLCSKPSCASSYSIKCHRNFLVSVSIIYELLTFRTNLDHLKRSFLTLHCYNKWHKVCRIQIKVIPLQLQRSSWQAKRPEVERPNHYLDFGKSP